MEAAVRNLKTGLAYFAIVFCAGFALAPLRLVWLVPRVGERAAELIELPVMLVVIVVAARWLRRRRGAGWSAADRVATGAIALALMLGAEFGLVLQLRGLGLAEYLAGRDPVAGTAYYLTLVAFTLMPWLLGRPRRSARPT